mgnify:FL=1
MTIKELDELIIDETSVKAYKEALDKWDRVAKPLGSLGDFEEEVARIAGVFDDVSFDIGKKTVIVMCADNGIVNEGISQSGQEVTRAVATSLGKRESSVCKLARVAGSEVISVDVGIAGTETPEGVLNFKIMEGTRNFSKEPAMTEEEVLAAIEAGIRTVALCKEQGCKILATGEMGIGNTTTSAAMTSALLSLEVEEITGRGAGLDDERLAHKKAVIKAALEKYNFESGETLRILETVGGLDIAAMAGVFIGGAIYHIPVVIDGLISAVAALTAEKLKPGVKEFMIASHVSREPAMRHILKELELKPVIDAGLALGEGTGAVMLFPLLDMAMELYDSSTSFSRMGIEEYKRFEN